MLNRNYENVKSSLKDNVGFVKLKLSKCKDWVKNKLILSKVSVKRRGDKPPTASRRANT